MSTLSRATEALEKGRGIVRLAPAWVPRSFCVPGRRIRLHPDDYYAFGGDRGGIDERWLASAVGADNGPKTTPNEGMSEIVVGPEPDERILLRDAVEALKDQLIGSRLWNEYGRWPSYSKFFDNKGALPFHIHQKDSHARKVGQIGKPESYFFPTQLNNYLGDFPFTFFGLKPGTTKAQVREALANFSKGDNKITDLSVAHRLEPGTGWDVPPGVLHAPGSLCTYEPQRDTDIWAMYQSLVGDQVTPEELLWRYTPKEKIGDVDYLLEAIDWELNLDPDFGAHHFSLPRPVLDERTMHELGYHEDWISYRSSEYSAKELTVFPGRNVTIKDGGAYGLIVLQGHGTMGVWDIEAPALIRFGQLTNDEFFVSEGAARSGVAIANPSTADPIVMLKHFGPRNPDLKVVD